MPVLFDEMFVANFEKGNRVQIPRLVRGKHKLDPGETLSVTVKSDYVYETFYVRLGRDGRIVIPKILVKKLRLKPGEVLKVTINSEGE
jgi:bifunctional DNA-binding transcriptional regulator/antitoxin component of YhaV-PrlF toxin-antitoxin module